MKWQKLMYNKVVFDVDGVLTDGRILYSSSGKTHKIFGPHDKDGLKLLKNYSLEVVFITADKIGFDITYRRIVTDWKYSPEQLIIVPEESRLNWFVNNCQVNKTIFMGDGYYDAEIFKLVGYSIAPNSARIEAKNVASFITTSNSGQGAVLDACLHIISLINEKL